MSLFAKLNPEDQMLVNQILQSPTGMSQAHQVALAKALADTMALPESSEVNSKLYYNDQLAIKASQLLSMLNEMVVFQMQYVEGLTRDFYCLRVDQSFGKTPNPSDLAGKGLVSFFNLTTFLSEETLAVISQTDTITIMVAGFKRLISSLWS
jgi:hypothetical protein